MDHQSIRPSRRRALRHRFLNPAPDFEERDRITDFIFRSSGGEISALVIDPWRCHWKYAPTAGPALGRDARLAAPPPASPGPARSEAAPTAPSGQTKDNGKPRSQLSGLIRFESGMNSLGQPSRSLLYFRRNFLKDLKTPTVTFGKSRPPARFLSLSKFPLPRFFSPGGPFFPFVRRR